MNRTDLQEMVDFFNALKNSTTPKAGEDPQSIADCWNFLEAHIISAKKEIEKTWRHQEYMSEVLNSGDGVYRP